MSNYLAIATVTAALQRTLQSTVGVDVEGATVTTVRPESNGSGTPDTGVNLYLYQVTPNAAWRNADLPTRRSDGTMSLRPQVALDLHYLLTFFGEESQLVPQRLLGSVARTLHTRPILTRDVISTVVDDVDYLQNSDLSDAVELVRFTPISLSLEELSKIWSVFFQVPYRLSIAYQASVVLIEEAETPVVAQPVLEPVIDVQPSVGEDTEAVSPDELSGLQLWLRADAGVTYESNGTVSEWADQSGSGNDAVQARDTRKPVFVPRILKGKPVIRFDGEDDYLAISNLHYTGEISEITVCAMVRSTSRDKQIIVSFDRSEYWKVAMSEPRNGYIGWETAGIDGTVDTLSSTKAYTDGRWHFVCALFKAGDPADKTIFVDGREAASTDGHAGANIGTGATRYGFIGVGSEAATFNGRRGPQYYFKGDLTDLLIYNRALSDSEREGIEQYIIERYA